MICFVFSVQICQPNIYYTYFLTIDPNSDIFYNFIILKPDFLIRNPYIFKAGKNTDFYRFVKILDFTKMNL